MRARKICRRASCLWSFSTRFRSSSCRVAGRFRSSIAVRSVAAGIETAEEARGPLVWTCADAMAELLDAKSLKLYKEVFDLFDYNANGSLNVGELSTILRALGQNVTEAEDSSGNGSLDFEEFLQLMTYRMKDTDLDGELKALFAELDADGDGVLGHSDVEQFAESSGGTISAAEAREALAEMDHTSKGRLRLEDFARAMTE